MIRNNKKVLIVSSVLILLPVLAGMLLWDCLPQQMPIHWGVDGAADGWSSRGFVVFGMPVLLLVLHWLCVFGTMKDRKNRGQNEKIFQVVLWITPLVALFTSGMTYLSVLGENNINVTRPTLLFMGIIFVVVGNYLPKCRQNYTIGIRVKWTLENEENWNVTHRVAGRVWVVGGVLFVFCAFLPTTGMSVVLFGMMLLLGGYPILFSWRYHKKQIRNTK